MFNAMNMECFMIFYVLREIIIETWNKKIYCIPFKIDTFYMCWLEQNQMRTLSIEWKKINNKENENKTKILCQNLIEWCVAV